MDITSILTDPTVCKQIIDRAKNPQRWAEWNTVLKRSGYCARPIRLSGNIQAVGCKRQKKKTLYSTESELEGVLLKACGTRREALCSPCAYRYRGDAWQIIAAGIRGGKGTPETVSGQPMVFATFTAPSFGAVHSIATTSHGRCQPLNHHAAAKAGTAYCIHGRPRYCLKRHTANDAQIGHPLCLDCYDYCKAVLFNALSPELWRRTTIYIKRELARLLGVTQRLIDTVLRLSFFKVAEYQKRGALHFHAVIRIDQREEQPASSLPALGVHTLSQAVLHAAQKVAVANPLNEDRRFKWGKHVDIQPLRVAEDPQVAAKTATYIAKYTTKSTESIGGVVHPVSRDGMHQRSIPPHIRRFMQTVFTLANSPQCSDMRLHRHAHTLGFAGHWATKSRFYSTTFRALRFARMDYQRKRASVLPEGVSIIQTWSYKGAGHRNKGDQILALTAAGRAREQQQTASFEYRTTRSLEGKAL